MTAVLVSIADAIKDEINSMTGLIREVTAERSYADWDLPLDDFDQLQVDVVPVNTAETELDARGQTRYLCRTYIGVRYRFRPEDRVAASGRIDLEQIDELIELLEQFHDEFIKEGNGRRLTSYTTAVWQETSIRTWYIREHLREHGQFTGIIETSYEVTKEQ